MVQVAAARTRSAYFILLFEFRGRGEPLRPSARFHGRFAVTVAVLRGSGRSGMVRQTQSLQSNSAIGRPVCALTAGRHSRQGAEPLLARTPGSACLWDFVEGRGGHWPAASA